MKHVNEFAPEFLMPPIIYPPGKGGVRARRVAGLWEKPHKMCLTREENYGEIYRI